MRACHLCWSLTEPAFVVCPLPDPLEIDSRPPVSRADLGHCARQSIPQTRLLGRRERDGLGPVMPRVFVPRCLCRPELIGNLKLQVCEGNDPRMTDLLGGLARQDVCSLVPWGTFVPLDPGDVSCPAHPTAGTDQGLDIDSSSWPGPAPSCWDLAMALVESEWIVM